MEAPRSIIGQKSSKEHRGSILFRIKITLALLGGNLGILDRLRNFDPGAGENRVILCVKEKTPDQGVQCPWK